MSPSIPKTCKAAVCESANAPLAIKDVPVSEPKDGEVLLKTVACGICHSDAFVQAGMMGNTFPRIPGHEIVGDIVAVGPNEKRWKVGDRVGGAWHGGHDLTCDQCKQGEFQFCDNATINGVMRDGGYSEYCLLRSEAAIKIPDGVDPVKTAPLLCAGITVFNGVRKLNPTPGSTIAVQGLGGLGHLAIQYMRQMGYRTVALSSSDAKKDMAMKLGAHDYFDSSKGDHGEALSKIGGASVIIVTAPNPEIIPTLLNGLAPRGKLLILAPVGDIPVNTVTMIMKGLSVHGWPSGHAIDSEDAIKFASHHGVECMVEKVEMKDINEAFERMNSGKVRFRGVMVF